MFEIGEYVVCGAKGVCQIRDITHIDMSGADKEKLYYVLARSEIRMGLFMFRRTVKRL